MRACSVCKKLKPSADYYKKISKAGYRTRKDGLSSACVVCHKVKQAESYQRRKDKVKNQQLISKFGISLDDYNQMLVQQQGCCAICKRDQNSFKMSLAVDHRHRDGKVRSLLCGNCNTALGMLKENFNSAISLAKYIQEHEGVV
jgi:hypothetical protein